MLEYLKPGTRVRVSSNDFYNGADGTLSEHHMIEREVFHRVSFNHPVMFRNMSYATGVFANSELIELEVRTCLN